jgi:hypothetical protein
VTLKNCSLYSFLTVTKNSLMSSLLDKMPASRKKKKMSGAVAPEVETELPPPALPLEDTQQMLHHGETSEYTLPSEDAPLGQMKGKEALRSATSGNPPSWEPPLNPVSPLLHGHTQMVADHQMQPPTLGPLELPDYGSTPHPGRMQLANLPPMTLERRLPETGNGELALTLAVKVG